MKSCPTILILLLVLVYFIPRSLAVSIDPTLGQSSAIKGDLPLSENFVVTSDGDFLFSGRKYLWRWSPGKTKLNRVAIGYSNRRLGRAMVKGHTAVWTHNRNYLFKVEPDSMAISSFDFKRFGEIKGIHNIRQEDLMILAGEQLLKLSLSDHSITTLRPAPPRDDFIRSDGENIYWFGKGLTIETLDGTTSKRILHCQGKQTLTLIAKEVWYRCQDRIYRFTKTARLLQVITNQSQDRLQAWSMTPTTHSYLFAHGLLEAFSLNTRELQAFQIEYKYRDTLSFKLKESVMYGLHREGPFLMDLSQFEIESTLD